MNLLFALWILGIPVGSTISFTWQAPTTNEDGSQLTSVLQYRLYEKIGTGPYRARMGINGKVTRVTYRVGDAGTYSFYMTAMNAERKESKPSNIVTIEVERPVVMPSPSPTGD